MAKIEGSVFCDRCGVEITWSPVIKDNHHYCCIDCYNNLECSCRPVADWEDDRPKSKGVLDDLMLD